ncbi:hypothetical protein [Kitasatospora sp. NPDC097691]|uniref:hypothetical protein n=1 Tax=Kitasatospora sp. NPDC097691 TaxID=3157231 RepID=UPI0033293C2B
MPPVEGPTPTGRGVVLSDPAPASAQWIVDYLATPGTSPAACPVPALEDLIVFDSDGRGRSRAAVVWLGEGALACLAVIDRSRGGTGIAATDELGALAAQETPMGIGASTTLTFFTVFPGDAGQVVIRDDDDNVFAALHQRVVDVGGGRRFTFVEYAYRNPVRVVASADPSVSPLSARARVCPASGGTCRPAGFAIP